MRSTHQYEALRVALFHRKIGLADITRAAEYSTRSDISIDEGMLSVIRA